MLGTCLAPGKCPGLTVAACVVLCVDWVFVHSSATGWCTSILFVPVSVSAHSFVSVLQARSSGVSLSCLVTLETQWTWDVSTSGQGRWCLENFRRTNINSVTTHTIWPRYSNTGGSHQGGTVRWILHFLGSCYLGSHWHMSRTRE